ncbi:hypothetical protein A7P96_05710 [Eikenella sp. NML03-A-027]|nr:hypothetical protein A7P96_05710 [Eikenella sp. NML03-A-027]
MRFRSTNLVLQSLRYIKQLAAVDGIGAGSINSAWSNVFDLAFETSRTNRNLVTGSHAAAASKRISRTAISD